MNIDCQYFVYFYFEDFISFFYGLDKKYDWCSQSYCIDYKM